MEVEKKEVGTGTRTARELAQEMANKAEFDAKKKIEPETKQAEADTTDKVPSGKLIYTTKTKIYTDTLPNKTKVQKAKTLVKNVPMQIPLNDDLRFLIHATGKWEFDTNFYTGKNDNGTDWVRAEIVFTPNDKHGLFLKGELLSGFKLIMGIK